MEDSSEGGGTFHMEQKGMKLSVTISQTHKLVCSKQFLVLRTRLDFFCGQDLVMPEPFSATVDTLFSLSVIFTFPEATFSFLTERVSIFSALFK
jgi:hypothetical protein